MIDVDVDEMTGRVLVRDLSESELAGGTLLLAGENVARACIDELTQARVTPSVEFVTDDGRRASGSDRGEQRRLARILAAGGHFILGGCGCAE